MDRQIAYKLGLERLDEFIIELGKNGFSYEHQYGQIKSEEHDAMVGRLLDTSPPYLVVNLPHPESPEQREGVSELADLADGF